MEIDCIHEALFILAACNLARSFDYAEGSVKAKHLHAFASVVELCNTSHDREFLNHLANKVDSIVGDKSTDIIPQLTDLLGKNNIHFVGSLDDFFKKLHKKAKGYDDA